MEKKNNVQRLFQILDKENLLKNKKFKVKIKKLIPQEADGGVEVHTRWGAHLSLVLNSHLIQNPESTSVAETDDWTFINLFWFAISLCWPSRPTLFGEC